MPWIETEQTQTYYEVHGEGPPLLLIPGRGLDHTSWAPQIGAYSQHFRTIVYDPRGVGQTRAAEPDAPFGVVDLAGDAEALLAALDVERVHLAGFSLGGMVATHMALRGNIHALSLMLHSTAHRASPHLRWRQRMSLKIIDTDDAELWAMFSAFTAFGAEFINAHEDVVQKEVDRRVTRWRGMSDSKKEGVRAQIGAAMTHDVGDGLLEIRVPTLVTVGSSDEVTRPEYARDMADLIPGAEFTLFPGAPHRVSTFMADDFNGVTLEFLLRRAV